MVKTVKLTIVIPARNEERYLPVCLNSIAKQTEKPDEVIVVNNASTDGTLKVAASYSFVKVLLESQKGIVFARNAGFNAATGDLIARLDADSVVPPDWVAQIKNAYLAAGSPEFYAATMPSNFRNFGPSFIWFGLHRLTYFWFGFLLMGTWPLFGANMFMTRKLWLKVRAKTCKFNNHEDMDLAWHIKQAGAKVHLLPDPKNSVLFRRVTLRSFYYPVMMVRTRFARHVH